MKKKKMKKNLGMNPKKLMKKLRKMKIIQILILNQIAIKIMKKKILQEKVHKKDFLKSLQKIHSKIIPQLKVN